MLSTLIFPLLIFVGVAFGLAWPIAMRLPLAPAEKITASVVLSLLGTFGFTWVVYTWSLPLSFLWILQILGTLGLAVGLRALAAAWEDADGRAILVGQFLVSAWCVAWLATIASYAGGGWTADWFEHWDRARFFLSHDPLDHKFLGLYSLTARPPLANVVTAAFLALTRADFAHYQLASTLLASLVFLPSALLARRFGRDARTIAICTVLFLANPLLLQNATFAWTKLPAALFVLAGLYFFLRAQERGAPLAVTLLCAASLAAGLLAHYSAGPYIVLLALGWLALGWARRTERDWQRSTVAAALTGAAVLALWFGWAMAKFGIHETLSSNSSITETARHQGSQLAKIALNLRDTLVPHFLRTLDQQLIAQTSSWGWRSDWFFQCYQVNLPLACGSIAWLAIGLELYRSQRAAGTTARFFWGAFIAGVILLGVGTHGARDEWGLAHICLQALVLLALAFLAARWSSLSRTWRVALIAGAAVDVAFGILLHGALQTFAFGKWFAARETPNDVFSSLSDPTLMNLKGKIVNQVPFYSDALAAPLWLSSAVITLVMVAAIVRASRREQPVAHAEPKW